MYIVAIDLVLDNSHEVIEGVLFKLDIQRAGFSVKADLDLARTDVADGRSIDGDDLWK